MSELSENIFKLRNEGKTYKEISKELDCSTGTVSYFLGDGQREKTFRRRTLLKKAIVTEIKMKYGGCCKLCGYKNCLEALDFHHTNPSNKNPNKYSIGALVANFSKAVAEAEAAKCILVCANCHREIHAGYKELPR